MKLNVLTVKLASLDGNCCSSSLFLLELLPTKCVSRAELPIVYTWGLQTHIAGFCTHTIKLLEAVSGRHNVWNMQLCLACTLHVVHVWRMSNCLAQLGVLCWLVMQVDNQNKLYIRQCTNNLAARHSQCLQWYCSSCKTHPFAVAARSDKIRMQAFLSRTYRCRHYWKRMHAQTVMYILCVLGFELPAT